MWLYARLLKCGNCGQIQIHEANLAIRGVLWLMAHGFYMLLQTGLCPLLSQIHSSQLDFWQYSKWCTTFFSANCVIYDCYCFHENSKKRKKRNMSSSAELCCPYQCRCVHSLIRMLKSIKWLLQEFALLSAYHPITNITIFQCAQQLQTFIFMKISL